MDATNFEEQQTTNSSATRSGRTSKKPNRFGFANLAFVATEAICGNVEEDIPVSTEDDTNVAKKLEWISAMSEEMLSLSDNNVFKVVRKPNECRIVKCRWVFALKRNSNGQVLRHKARLVSKGYSQVQGGDFDEVFAPVVRFETLRFLLAHVAYNDMELYQVDVKTAFLYGTLNDEIFMEIPSLPREFRNEIRSKVIAKGCTFGTDNIA